MRTNYHTHHKYCGHAVGNVAEYVEAALEQDIRVLGISDHCPYPGDIFPRMTMEQFEAYIEELEEAKQTYHNRIELFSGIEAEYIPEYYHHYVQMKERLDYMILGVHYIEDGQKKLWNRIRETISEKRIETDYFKHVFYLTTDDEIEEYGRLCEEALSTGLYDCLAHPDIYMNSYPEWSPKAFSVAKRIIKAAKKYNVPLEFNARGIRNGFRTVGSESRYGYPYIRFWELAAEEGVPVIIGSDAHDPKELYDESMQRAYELAQDLGLSIVKTLLIKKKPHVR